MNVEAGTYRVNRVRLLVPDERKIMVRVDGGEPRLDPTQLSRLPIFSDVDGPLLQTMAGRLVVERFDAGSDVVREGETGDRLFIIAQGTIEISRIDERGQRVRLDIVGPGSHFGEAALYEQAPRNATAVALSPTTFLTLQRSDFDAMVAESPELRANIERAIESYRLRRQQVDEYGQSRIDSSSGHEGEAYLPETFVDYEPEPREYPLSVAQTILRVHTRVSDLYNDPIDQLQEQLRVSIEGIREQQEHAIINNPSFGLLNQAAASMRMQPRSGVPTPDDMDDLLSMVWKKPAFFLAHPRAIAAFGRECTRRGVPPPTVNLYGSPFLTWRGVPLVPCDKLLVDGHARPAARDGLTNILLVRVGELDQGLVGLHHVGLDGELDSLPGLSVRLMGINQKAIAAYLLSIYFSAAVLADDALGVMENVEVGQYHVYER